MLTVPFLTEIDPQAAIKGSRDPLGTQTIWSRLGRHVVGNLTTVTTSVRDFTTTILGYYFAERVADQNSADDDLGVFLRWEQLAAHARFRVNGDERIRGIERVMKAKNESDRIRIAADATGQILSNQKTYGLWGLYTAASRASGLVDGEPTRLADAGRMLVEDIYLPAFAAGGLRGADVVVRRLSKPKFDLDASSNDALFLRAIGRVLSPRLAKQEREIFRNRLLFGRAPDRTDGRQAALVTAIDAIAGDDDWTMSPARARHLAKTCRPLGPAGEAAAVRLERIRVAEELLAPCAALFDLVLASDGQSLADVGGLLKRRWGARVATIDPDAVAELEIELRDSTGDVDTGRRWVRVANALAGGSYQQAIELLMEQNGFVMKTRAGAGPWADLSENRLRVRYREETLGALPDRNELPALWRHSYFLDALRAIAVQLSN